MSAFVGYFFDLEEEECRQIVGALGPHLTDARRAKIRRVLSERTREVTVVLEDIASAHNAAAVMRTAEALGIHQLHLIPYPSPFRLSRNVSSGAHKWLDVRQYSSASIAYASLKNRGYSVWASSVHGDALPLDEIGVDQRVALVFGNEHGGISEEARVNADGLFRIPTTGFVESLNISVAAAVSMHHVLSRMRANRSVLLPSHEQKQIEALFYARSLRSSDMILREATLPQPRVPGIDFLFEA